MDFSHLDWPSILVTAALASIGPCALLVIKQLYERSLEEKKVHWERASWVHQRQVEALTKLFVEFHQMHDLLQGAATHGLRSQSEMNQGGLLEKCQLKVTETWSEYIEDKLLLNNKKVVDSIEKLFKKFDEARIAIRLAPIYMEGENRKEAVAAQLEAIEIATKLIPPLLIEIEYEARRVIHDESR